MNIDREYLVNTLRDLIRINSINPSLAPGGAGEAEIAAYVAEAMRRLGLGVRTHEPEPVRVSVVGTLKGTGGGRSLMLNAHMDTVGVDEMPNPFSAEVREGRVYGRGAYDMKGSLAACLAAIKALVDSGTSLGGDLLIAAVADEEYASLGTAEVVKHYHPDAAIVTEPTELAICIAHKGFVWLEVETVGRAAHGSNFAEGVDANMLMGRFLAELETLERDLRGRKGHFLVGPASLHAATLSGGTELSMYAARCKLHIERRTIPGETEAQVVAELQAIVERLSAADPMFRATLKHFFVRNSFFISPDAPIVRALEHAAASVLGKPPDMVGKSFWMDAALFSAAGIETVVLGPSGAGAHAKEEWVDLRSVEDAARILVETAAGYCQRV
jgi:acetylornithine deacetylase